MGVTIARWYVEMTIKEITVQEVYTLRLICAYRPFSFLITISLR